MRAAGWQATSEALRVTANHLVLLCTNRRLGAPRDLRYAGEELFNGVRLRGLAGDNVGLDWSGKRILIIGHGPYAIEQTRTALEHSAAHVQILCRRHGLVCPQILDYLNVVRPFTDEFVHPVDGSGMMLQLWQRAYGLAAATPPETWKRGVFRPDGHSVSVSDIYFIGHHYGLIGTKTAKIKAFDSEGVTAESGEHFSADVVIKCIGFEVNEGNERLLGRARMTSSGMAGRGVWCIVEPHLDEAAVLLPLVGHVSVRLVGSKAWPHMRPGKIFESDGSVAEGISPSGAARGDRFVGMDDEKLESSSFDRVRGLAARLKELGDALSGALAAEPRLQLTITNHTHALFACFPGNGSKYNVHYDGGAGDPRKLTAILYVNEGWQAEWDGRLMMYDAGGFSMNGPTEKCWRSITPLAGRLVLFRSDLVLHKVNPAWGRRFALTMFYAARTQAELKSEERKSRASSTGLSKITLK